MDEQRRVVLPIHDRTNPPTPMIDANDPDSSYPMIEEVRPPAGAPNVLVLADAAEDEDHFISPEHQCRIAMARQ